MNEILGMLGVVLGLVASLIEILQFFKVLSVRIKTVLIIVIAVAISISFYSWYHIDASNEKKRIDEIKNSFIRNDARVTSAAIIISGWENSGDYMGYLTQIVGFYGRHPELYKNEYETYKKELQSFSEFFQSRREGNEFTYSSEWDQLRGLVTSGRDNLKSICCKKDTNF